jgi:hypothetical protein
MAGLFRLGAYRSIESAVQLSREGKPRFRADCRGLASAVFGAGSEKKMADRSNLQSAPPPHGRCLEPCVPSALRSPRYANPMTAWPGYLMEALQLGVLFTSLRCQLGAKKRLRCRRPRWAIHRVSVIGYGLTRRNLLPRSANRAPTQIVRPPDLLGDPHSGLVAVVD